MSAVNQDTPPSDVIVTDPGPQEIVFAHEVVAKQKPSNEDVTDVEVKEPATSNPSTVEEPADPAATEENRDEKGRFKGVQNRIDDLTRARREAERDAAYWKARAQAGTDSVQNPAQPAAPVPPKAEDFPTPEAFQDAVIDYRVDQKIAEKLAQKDTEQSAVAQIKERASTWQGHLAEARAANPDFDAVLEKSEVLIAPHVSDMLIEQGLTGAKMLLHLAENPELGDKLNAMSVPKAALELAKIAMDAGFVSASVPKADLKSVAKPVTTAPAPIKPIGSNRTTTPSVEDMSMDDYVAMRKKQGANWAR